MSKLIQISCGLIFRTCSLAGCEGQAQKLSSEPSKPPVEAVASKTEDNRVGASTVSSSSQDPQLSQPVPITVADTPPAKAPPSLIAEPDGIVPLTFDTIDLKKLIPGVTSEIEAAKQLPKWLRDLDGRRVRIRGFMLPLFQETGIEAFTLDRDLRVMNFGPNPPVSSLCDVKLRKGVTTDYIENRPFEVVGVFHIGANVVPGEFYSLDDAVISHIPRKPKP